ELPRVSVVIPAYNEETQIASAVEAVINQDYPADRMQILVVSDASTDRTDEIVRRFENRGVQLLRIPERSGKTTAENLAQSHVTGEIIVNTDASIRLHPQAVRELAIRMADPRVGVASGRDVSVSRMDADRNATEAGYIQYEMRVRRLETLTGGIVGASGSLYAIRAELQKLSIRGDLSRDFSAVLTARKHGLVAVSVDEAVCYVPRTGSLDREYKRKVRTISRGMRTLHHERRLLNPATFGLFALKLFSHKVCRWALPVALIPGAVGLALLAPDHPVALIALAGGTLLALLAAIGAFWPAAGKPPRVLSIAAFGVAANVAVLHALMRVTFTDAGAIWEPTRREESLRGTPTA
ncbi:MAG: glycosyltransferase, partial [Gemmatimonadaceae bacterium]